MKHKSVPHSGRKKRWLGFAGNTFSSGRKMRYSSRKLTPAFRMPADKLTGTPRGSSKVASLALLPEGSSPGRRVQLPATHEAENALASYSAEARSPPAQ